MLKAYSIIVEGDIQGVGFRRAVKKLALQQNITGSVKNLDDGTVEIIVQGEEEKIESLLQSIQELKPPIRVEGNPKKTAIRVSKKRTGFAIKRGTPDEELEEGLASGQEQLVVLGNKIDKLGGKIDTLNEDSTKNFTELGSKIETFNGNTTRNFDEIANRYDNISETLAKVVEESAKSREDFKTAVKTLTEAQTKQFKDGLDTLTNLAREYFDERRAELSKEKKYNE